MNDAYVGFEVRSPTDEILEHYGILGMRWGVRRFQNKDGSLTNAGQKRYEGSSDKKVRHKPSSARKLAKQRAANLEKARQAKIAKKQYEEDKKKALESGTAEDILRYKGKLTNQELQTAVNRINLETQLSNMAQKDVKSGWDKMDSLMNKVGKVTDYSNKAINLYNVIAKINNSFSDSKMQVIDGVGKKVASKMDKLIKTGSPEEILNAVKSGKLTEDQTAAAIKRLNAEKTLKTFVDEKNGSEKSTTATNKTDKQKSESKKETNKKETTSQNAAASGEKKKAESQTQQKSKKDKGPVNDGTWSPGKKDVSSGGSTPDKDKYGPANSYAKAEEWARKKAKETRPIYDAVYEDIKDSPSTSAGYNYSKNADFMTLPTGQVIPLLPASAPSLLALPPHK